MRTTTERLLLCGAIAGPAFVLVVLLQDYTRPGMDPRTQDLSLLALGDWGWIQTLNFIGTGVLDLLYAVGLRRRLHGGRSGTAAPVLIALYGLGLVSAGLFQDDPANGFPPGVIAPSELSWHATLHDLAGLVAFFALTGGLLALGRAFLERHERSWALYATVSAAALLAVFLGTAGTVWEARGFRLATLIGWIAASLIALRLSIQDASTGAMSEPRA